MGDTARLFAPGIASTGLHDDGGPAFRPDGGEMLSRVSGPDGGRILVTQRVDGRWRSPHVAPFSGTYDDGPPSYAAGGDRVYFSSDRPLAGEEDPGDANIWYVERIGDTWSEPQPVGSPVNTDAQEVLAGVTRDETLFFVRVPAYGDAPSEYKAYRAEQSGGTFEAPVLLDSTVNDPEHLSILVAVAPDERYVILAIAGRSDGMGREDLYVSFNQAGRWSEPVTLGPAVNSASSEWLASISPDQRFLFFTSFRTTPEPFGPTSKRYALWADSVAGPQDGRGGDVYWVSTSTIERLRR